MVKKLPNPIDAHVGNRVRMQRVLRGLSQEKLGEALGVTFQQVQKYEKGSNRIGASRLQQLSEILEVPPSFFFDGLPSADDVAPALGFAEAPGATFVSHFVSSAEGLQLNRAFVRIHDSKLRRRLIELVSAIADASETLPRVEELLEEPPAYRANLKPQRKK